MSEQSGRVVRLIELEKLIPFEKHPFVVREDEQMKMLVNSIRDVGVLVPGIVRPLYDDTFEIISGHRGKRPVKLLVCRICL